MQLHAGRRPTRLSVCRQCLQTWLPARAALTTTTTTWLSGPRPRGRLENTSVSVLSQRPRHASYLLNLNAVASSAPHDAPRSGRAKPIREYLRDLADEDAAQPFRPLPRDAARAGATQNSLTRVESHALAELASDSPVIDGSGDDTGDDTVKLWQDSGEDTSTPESLFARPYGTVSPKAGDLIEVSTDSWRVQLLAVCLGNFRGVDHFYTNTGKWFASSNVRTMFHVTNFATPEDLAPVIAALPTLAKDGDVGSGQDGQDGEASTREIHKILNTLQDMKQGPSREAGAGLLKKMQAFAHQSSTIHMTYATLLDNAYAIVRKAIFPPPPARFLHAAEPFPVCWNKPFTQEETLELYKKAYFSLDDIASILFRHRQSVFPGAPSSRFNHRNAPMLRNYVDAANNSRSVGADEFTAPAMYAIYRALVSDDVAFRPVSTQLGNPNEITDAASVVDAELSRSRSCLFAVARPEDVDMVTEVEALVREFNEDSDNIPDNGQVRDLADTKHRLAAFIMNAREAIDYSRKTRYWSPYGMLLSRPQKNDYVEKRASSDAKDRIRAFLGWTEDSQHERFTRFYKSPPPNLMATRKKWNSQTLGNEKLPESPAYNPRVQEWYPYDIMVLHFMHLWASYQRFSPSSRLHWIGASILRATQRYEGSEYLTMSTGWTFLQEVGYLKPWDVPARYAMSLPDVQPKRDGTLDRTTHLAETFEKPGADVYNAHNPEDLLSEDLFLGKRKIWNNVITYCIDSADTEDVDDGISIEKKRNGQYWVHVHVADPGSCIRPGSKLAEMAQQMPQTSYLPGYNAPMFPESIVRKRFSLAKGQPCLTFSGLLSRDGEMLETRITPGVLGEVICMTPEELSAVVTQEEKELIEEGRVPKVAQPRYADLPWTTASFAIGTPVTKQDQRMLLKRRRVMWTAEDLPRAARAELKSLMRAATMLRGRRLRKGAMPLYWPRPQVKVNLLYTDVVKSQSLIPSEEYSALGSLPDSLATWKGGRSTTFYRCTGDPYIKIFYDGFEHPQYMASASVLQMKGSSFTSGAGNRLVESLMRMAGEIAADWCAERNIAVPFRGQPAAIPHLERLEKMAREVIYPELLAGRRPSDDALIEFRRLLGSDEITAVPVPHVTMGVPRYTKATSPLRRYSDLVVHWQIEHALRAEMNEASAAVEEQLVAGLSAGGDKDKDNGNEINNNNNNNDNRWTYWGRDPDSVRKAAEKKESQHERDARITGPCFTREQLERDVLPLLRVRERTMRALDNRVGRDQWMLQALVRAWKGGEYVEVVERPQFGEDRRSMRRARKLIKQQEKRIRRELKIKTKKIATPFVPPELKKVAFRNMRFTVTGVNLRQGLVIGRLDWFERVALMEIAGLNPENEEEADEEDDEEYDDDDLHDTPEAGSMTPLALEDIQPGQVYPVALDHVDVHANRVIVRRTGNLCVPEVEEPAPRTKAEKMRAKREHARAQSEAAAKEKAKAAAKAAAAAAAKAAKTAAASS